MGREEGEERDRRGEEISKVDLNKNKVKLIIISKSEYQYRQYVAMVG